MKIQIYTNSPTDHLTSGGTPQGHVALNNYLSIPVLLAGELVEQITLTNKKSGYSEKDIATIKRLGEFYPHYHLEQL